MAESVILQTKPRDSRGTKNARRMRRTGMVPGILYGHGEATLSVTLVRDDLAKAIRHGARVVDLDQAGKLEKALIREIQWDPLGHDILHVDFARVSADERVHVKVPLEVRGQAAGLKEGGIIEHLIHEVEIECPVAAIPDKVIINVAALKVDESMTVGQATLPEGAKIVSGMDEIAVQCLKPLETEEEAAAAPGAEGAEPELIRKEKPAEEEEAKE